MHVMFSEPKWVVLTQSDDYFAAVSLVGQELFVTNVFHPLAVVSGMYIIIVFQSELISTYFFVFVFMLAWESVVCE